MSEAKLSDGISTGVLLGEYQGNEYWESIDKSGNHCLLVVEPISRGGAGGCTPTEFYETRGSAGVYLIPTSENPISTEMVMIPEDVDPQGLAESGYQVLGERVAINAPSGLHRDKEFPLPRTDASKPPFVYQGAPR